MEKGAPLKFLPSLGSEGPTPSISLRAPASQSPCLSLNFHILQPVLTANLPAPGLLRKFFLKSSLQSLPRGLH